MITSGVRNGPWLVTTGVGGGFALDMPAWRCLSWLSSDWRNKENSTDTGTYIHTVQYIKHRYSETSLIRHSMGPENNVGLGGCWIMECLLPYLCMVTTPHIMVRLERMLDYRGVGLARFHCTWVYRRCIHVLLIIYCPITTCNTSGPLWWA